MGQPVAPLRPALAAHDPGGAQLREDVLQERQGDPLCLGDLIDLAGGIGAAVHQLHGRPYGVVGLRGHAHTRDSTESVGPVGVRPAGQLRAYELPAPALRAVAGHGCPAPHRLIASWQTRGCGPKHPPYSTRRAQVKLSASQPEVSGST